MKSALLCLAALSLLSCAGGHARGERIADMPWWAGCRTMHRRAAARRNTMFEKALMTCPVFRL
jgi:hypothetical protein